MQRLIWALLFIISLLLVAVVSVVIGRAGAGKPKSAPVTSSATPCPELSEALPPILPELGIAPLSMSAPGLTLRVDGEPAGATLNEGDHVVDVGGDGGVSTSVRIHVTAFTPVLLEARATAGSVVLVILGARCVTCSFSDTDLNLSYRIGGVGDVRGVAHALATADWASAVQQVRSIPPQRRTEPEFHRLLAALHAFSGRPTLARAELRGLPKTDPLLALIDQHERAERQADAARLSATLARWNGQVERFQRLTDRFGAHDGALATQLTRQFDALSERFTNARAVIFDREQVLDETQAALRDAVETLRHQRPTDCEWQRQVSAAL